MVTCRLAREKTEHFIIPKKSDFLFNFFFFKSQRPIWCASVKFHSCLCYCISRNCVMVLFGGSFTEMSIVICRSQREQGRVSFHWCPPINNITSDQRRESDIWKSRLCWAVVKIYSFVENCVRQWFTKHNLDVYKAASKCPVKNVYSDSLSKA